MEPRPGGQQELLPHPGGAPDRPRQGGHGQRKRRAGAPHTPTSTSHLDRLLLSHIHPYIHTSSSTHQPLHASLSLSLPSPHDPSLCVEQDPSLLAEDFEFLAPIVGPLSKAKFLKAFESFNLKKAFPGTTAEISRKQLRRNKEIMD